MPRILNMQIDPASIPDHPLERSGWVITQLKLRGLSLRSLAAKGGATAQSLSLALRAPNLPGETLIAEALGIDLPTLFKERYSANGERLFRVRNRSASRPRRNAKARNVA
jgi:lambda repressor-like predicted transcriptional regulator